MVGSQQCLAVPTNAAARARQIGANET